MSSPKKPRTRARGYAELYRCQCGEFRQVGQKPCEVCAALGAIEEEEKATA